MRRQDKPQSSAPFNVEPDVRVGRDPADTRKDRPDGKGVHFGCPTGRCVLRNDHFITSFPGLFGGRLDAEIGGDAAKNNRLYSPAPKLYVKVSAVKCAPLMFGYSEVTRMGEALNQLGPVFGQTARRMGKRFIDWRT